MWWFLFVTPGIGHLKLDIINERQTWARKPDSVSEQTRVEVGEKQTQFCPWVQRYRLTAHPGLGIHLNF